MESRGTITNRQYNGVSAVIAYDGTQLIVSTKPAWVSIVFGVVGETLASAKERFRIKISDVVSSSFSETRTGRPVIEIITTTDSHKITFPRNDELTAILQRDLNKVGAR